MFGASRAARAVTFLRVLGVNFFTLVSPTLLSGDSAMFIRIGVKKVHWGGGGAVTALVVVVVALFYPLS